VAAGFWSIVEAHGSKRVSGDTETVGYVVGLLTWVLAGGVFVAAKGAIDEMPPWTLCFWRLLIATAVLLPFVRHQFGPMRDFVRAHGLSAFSIGALGWAFTQGLMFTGLEYTSAVTAGIVFATNPIMTLVLAHFVLHERMSTWQVIGSVVALAGIVVIAVKGSLVVLIGLDLNAGDLIVMAAAAIFAVYTVLLRRQKYQLERMPLLVVLMTGAVIGALPFFIYELLAGEHANLAMKGYLALAYAAIPGGALMYLLYNWSVDILGASRAGGLLYTQMVFTAALAWLVLGEPIEAYHLAGAALIIVGVVLITFLKPRAPATATPSAG
jgi:drug/metabolite transporter (DMT)-like permease